MSDFKFVLDEEAFFFFQGLKRSERMALLSAFEHLSRDPYQLPGTTLRTVSRDLGRKRFGRFQVVYWIDHGAREVRILDSY